MSTLKLIDQFLTLIPEETTSISKKSSIELETRFKDITYSQFKKILDKLQHVDHKMTMTKSIVSIIRKGETTGILMEMICPNDPISSDQPQKLYREKTILFDPLHDNSMGIPYKLTVSREKEIESCDMKNADLVRIKIRFSFVVTEFPDWTIDLTIMRQLNKSAIGSSLKTIVNEMLKVPGILPNTLESIFKLDEHNSVYTYELEAEYHGDIQKITNKNIFEMIEYVIKSVDDIYIGNSQYNQFIKEIAEGIHFRRDLSRYTLKEILPQVDLMTKDIYCKMFPPKNLYITDKADGLRCVIVIKESQLNILTDTLTVQDLKIDPSIYIICDCEFINNIAYIFDVMQYSNSEVEVDTLGYGDRIAYIDEIVDIINSNSVKRKIIYNDISDIDSALKPDHSYDTDGLIFIEDRGSYLNTKTYKWKPLEHNTIDFLAMKYNYPSDNEIKEGYDLYYLFNGINSESFLSMNLRTCPEYRKLFKYTSKSYFPIQFSPSSCPKAYVYYHPSDAEDINNKVVELRLLSNKLDNPEWSLVKIRKDRQLDVDSSKYFGNDFRIAELTWNIFLDPLTIDELKNGCNKSYFLENKATMYFAQVNVLSFIKEQRIKTFANSKWVIDACSGRGADLGKFLNSNISNLVCIDQDQSALAELVRRKYSFMKIRKTNKRTDTPNWAKKHGTAVYVIVADYGNKKQVLQKTKTIIPKDGVDHITCNFALHYFMGTQDSVNNFILLCKSLLKKGGSISLSFMIGEKVFDILKEVDIGETIDTYDHQVIKNSIKKLYKESEIIPFGQKIGVLLPFSKGEYYEEYLVNTQELINAFELHGFKCGPVIAVKNSIPQFKHERPNIYNQLTNDDKWYLDLFGELIITK